MLDLVLTVWHGPLAVEFVMDYGLTGEDCLQYLFDNPLTDLACKLSEGDFE